MVHMVLLCSLEYVLRTSVVGDRTTGGGVQFGNALPSQPAAMTGSAYSATAATLLALWLHANLVDPASSHMLVSKTKPCMSQYK